MKHLLIAIIGLACTAKAASAAVVIAPGTYSQNFNTLASGVPEGWGHWFGANATAFTTTATGWGNASPGARNSASTQGLVAGSSASNQLASTNRALSLSVGGVPGNGSPGGALTFNFSTLGVEVTTFSFDLLMLRPGLTPGVWSIQVGVGASPTWTLLNTYSSSTWGSTTYTYTPTQFGTLLDNAAEVWFRVVVTSAGTGTPYENVGIDNFSLTAIPAVPEPGAVALGVGACLLVAARCRRRRG